MALVGQMTVIQGANAGQKFILDQRHVFEIGRAESSTIRVNDETVAMNHCRVYREEGNVYTIYDLNSTAGTAVNGQQITKQAINDGDKIQIGNVVFEFKMEEGASKNVEDADVAGFSLDDFSGGWGAQDGQVANPDKLAQTEALIAIDPVGSMGKLTIIEGEDRGKEIQLTREGTFIIGRAMNADIKIMDIKASRNHCQVERQGQEYFVDDKNSRNGTFLNGEKVNSRIKLNNGDYIKIGFTVLKFEVV